MAKYYLSGKMTGLKEVEIWKNFSSLEKNVCENFSDVESVMNPAVTYAMRKFDAFSYEDWLKIDFAMLDACDAIVLHPNWEDSMGAKREIVHAWETNKDVWFPFVKTEIYNPKGFKYNGKKYLWTNDPKRVEQIVIEVKKHDILKKIEASKDAAVTEAAMQEINKIKAEKWQ